VVLLLCSFAKISDDEDDDTLVNLGADIENKKLSQTVDNPSDKPGAPRCCLRSGTLLCYLLHFDLACVTCAVPFCLPGSEFWLLRFQIIGRKNHLGCSHRIS